MVLVQFGANALINFSRERHGGGGAETWQNFLIAALNIYPCFVPELDWNDRQLDRLGLKLQARGLTEP